MPLSAHLFFLSILMFARLRTMERGGGKWKRGGKNEGVDGGCVNFKLFKYCSKFSPLLLFPPTFIPRLVLVYNLLFYERPLICVCAGLSHCVCVCVECVWVHVCVCMRKLFTCVLVFPCFLLLLCIFFCMFGSEFLLWHIFFLSAPFRLLFFFPARFTGYEENLLF